MTFQLDSIWLDPILEKGNFHSYHITDYLLTRWSIPKVQWILLTSSVWIPQVSVLGRSRQGLDTTTRGTCYRMTERANPLEHSPHASTLFSVFNHVLPQLNPYDDPLKLHRMDPVLQIRTLEMAEPGSDLRPVWLPGPQFYPCHLLILHTLTHTRLLS